VDDEDDDDGRDKQVVAVAWFRKIIDIGFVSSMVDFECF
jgi:hypothetical protein